MFIRIRSETKPDPLGIFDDTIPTGQITTQGNNITDENGNRICGGGMNAGINQRPSGN